MNTKQKKALYESIMKSVSKTVKKTLNEANNDLHEIKCFVTDFDNDIYNDILYRGTYEECEAYIFDFDEDTGKSEGLTDILGILHRKKHINTHYFMITEDEYDKENGMLSFYITSRKTYKDYKIIFDIL